MAETDPLLLAPAETSGYGATVAAALDAELEPLVDRDFGDGEHKMCPRRSVRGRDVFVIQSLHNGPQRGTHDKLVRLLFLVGALRDADARSVTAVAPYLCYARKDMKTKPRDPVSTRYVAAMLESVGTDRVVAMDVHNLAAFQNSFRCRTEHLDARRLFVDHFEPLVRGAGDTTVLSPDAGGVKRAEVIRRALAERTGRSIGAGFVEKYRSGGELSGESVVGPVEGRTVLILDDMIASGSTLRRAAGACRDRGATAVHAGATHGVFAAGVGKNLATDALDSVTVTDTAAPRRADAPALREKLTVLETGPLVAEAIRRIHIGGSIVELLDPNVASEPPEVSSD